MASVISTRSSSCRNHSGGLQFPRPGESQTWLRLPAGYAGDVEELEPGRLLQVGVLYRAEVMAMILTPGSNRWVHGK